MDACALRLLSIPIGARSPRVDAGPGAAAAVSKIFARYLEPGAVYSGSASAAGSPDTLATGKTCWGLATVRGILTIRCTPARSTRVGPAIVRPVSGARPLIR